VVLAKRLRNMIHLCTYIAVSKKEIFTHSCPVKFAGVPARAGTPMIKI
jgi:hypothetical protein